MLEGSVGMWGWLQMSPFASLVKAAVEGRLPRGIGLARLIDAPAEWDQQRRMLGLAVSLIFLLQSCPRDNPGDNSRSKGKVLLV
jgi:hypothetical protein